MKKKIFLFIYLFFIGFIINLIIPITPKIFEIKNIPISYFGFFNAFFALGSIISGLLIVLVIKKYHQINFLPFLGFLGASQWLIILARNEGQLLLIRFLAGLFAGMLIVLSNAMIINLSRQDRLLVKNMAIAIGVFGLGNSFGYLIGGLLGSLNYQIPIYIGLFSALLIAFISVFIKYDKVSNLNHENKKKNNKKLLFFIIINTLWLTYFSLISSVIPFLIVNIMKQKIYVIGIFMFSAGVLGLLINFYLNPFFKKHFNYFIGIIVAFLLTVSALILIVVFWNNQLSVLAFMLLFLLAISLGRPIFSALIVIEISDDMLSLSVSNLSMYLGSIIGSILAAIAFSIHSNLVFIYGIIIAGLIAFLIFILKIVKKQ